MEENPLPVDAPSTDSTPPPEETLEPHAAPEPAVAAETDPAETPAAEPEPVAQDKPIATQPEAEWLAQIKKLHSRFAEQERLSADRERIIDRLHEENQRLKQGELLKSMTPVYRDLMRLYDDLQKTAQDYAAKDQITVQAAVGDWNFFATAVTDLLYRYGVDILPIEPGSPFDAKSQRAAAVRKTAEPTQDKTVARVLTTGFSAENRILRPAAIEVFRYEQPAPAEHTTEAEKGDVTNA